MKEGGSGRVSSHRFSGRGKGAGRGHSKAGPGGLCLQTLPRQSEAQASTNAQLPWNGTLAMAAEASHLFQQGVHLQPPTHAWNRTTTPAPQQPPTHTRTLSSMSQPPSFPMSSTMAARQAAAATTRLGVSGGAAAPSPVRSISTTPSAATPAPAAPDPAPAPSAAAASAPSPAAAWPPGAAAGTAGAAGTGGAAQVPTATSLQLLQAEGGSKWKAGQ